MKWEYKTVRFQKQNQWKFSLDRKLIEEKMTQLGAEGWELVSFVTQNALLGHEITALAVFKRASN